MKETNRESVWVLRKEKIRVIREFRLGLVEDLLKKAKTLIQPLLIRCCILLARRTGYRGKGPDD